MKTLEQIIAEFSNEELKKGFEEIVEWRKTGILKVDGVVREAHKQFTVGANVMYPIHAMDTPFLFEISKRHYAEKEQN
ncbi:hypothetical protein CVD28_01215 [Bacillus sp. M6-12]|uniref:hypothetical protein n=1 Tax=Bacillus sp. M6-12 TaxID=2054166 RepID=UPI000C774648|nr:hypothetical protein [Bacillus sp. M6-12]PLS19053.1 hypothetical protein CVD28_01215 [Bacillus sp. M6-12]